MARRQGGSRSFESPMDFEFTSRPSTNMKPVWVAEGEDPSTPRKRTLGEANPPASPFPDPPHTPTFGRIQNVPFMLNIPPPQVPQPHHWVPPPDGLPGRAFPPSELRDIDMSEPSPPRPNTQLQIHQAEISDEINDRAIAAGGMRRVFRSRQKLRERSKLAVGRATVEDEEDCDAELESDEEGRLTPITQNTSNHYTLNLPGPVAPRSDTPYVLLGYLQFFFNLSLILLFLYLLVQFILTVQRDVEHRISEYSMDIVQEIAQCALQFKSNLCATNHIPAMARQCGAWETCMNRDPTKVGRAKVGAELIAEVVNGFVEPISWKTLLFTLTSLSFLTVFINSLLSLYRSKHNPSNVPTHQHQSPIPTFPLSHVINGPPGWPAKSWTGTPEIEELPSRRRKLSSGAAKEIK